MAHRSLDLSARKQTATVQRMFQPSPEPSLDEGGRKLMAPVPEKG